MAFRTRRSNGCSDGVDTDPTGTLAEVTAVHGISIAEHMAWLVTPRRGFDHLAPHPGRGRVRGHMDVHEFAPTMGNEDQHVQGLEGEGGHREQVSGPQVMGVVAQERPPDLAGGASRSAPAVASNRPVADDDAELEQLAPDPLGAPEPVLATWSGSSPALGTEMGRPPRERDFQRQNRRQPLPMPADHRVRRDDRQMLAPAGAPSQSQDPEQLVPEA